MSPNFPGSAKHALLFISLLKQIKTSLISETLVNVFLAFQPSKRGLIGVCKQPKPGTRTGGKLLDAFTYTRYKASFGFVLERVGLRPLPRRT